MRTDDEIEGRSEAARLMIEMAAVVGAGNPVEAAAFALSVAVAAATLAGIGRATFLDGAGKLWDDASATMLRESD